MILFIYLFILLFNLIIFAKYFSLPSYNLDDIITCGEELYTLQGLTITTTLLDDNGEKEFKIKLSLRVIKLISLHIDTL